MSHKILVVDDEQKMVRLLRSYLEAAGFQAIVAYDGQEALAAFRHGHPDLVVLDLNLPGLDGLDVCRAIRKESNVPVIMLTARVEEADRLVGLELGADDYVSKPFSPRELVARVRAVLRRAGGEEYRPQVIAAGDIVIDLGQHTVAVRGQPVDLTPTEFDLLALFARYPGRTFTRLQLLEEAMGDAYEGYERTVDSHIKNLRRKIEADPRQPQYIQTVFGVGYRFVEVHR